MTELNDVLDITDKVSNYTEVNSFFLRLLNRFGEGDYEGARKIFYSSLGNFGRLFDDSFLVRCAFNEYIFSIENERYDYSASNKLLHARFCADLYEFSVLVFRQNKKSFSYNADMDFGKSYFKVLGFSRLVDFKTLYIKHESDLSKRVNTSSPYELLEYIYHVILLFGGLWRTQTKEILSSIEDYTIPAESKFYMVQSELATCLTVFGVFRPPMYVEIILPKHTEDLVRTADDVLLYHNEKKKQKNKDGFSTPSEIKEGGL